MKKVILIFLVTVFAPFVCSVHAQPHSVWIDVRTQAEWDEGHLKNAILIPYTEIAQKIGEHVKNKRQIINLYCRSGHRAEIALKTLEKLGYLNVQNRGGLMELRLDGMD